MTSQKALQLKHPYKMKSITLPLLVAAAIHDVGSTAPTSQDEFIDKRLENGLGRTPALGYNNWVCDPLFY